MSDPNFVTVTAAQSRRVTIGSSGFLVVFESGMQVDVPRDAVAQLLKDGLIIPPGTDYVPAPGSNMGMPPKLVTGATMLRGGPAQPSRKTVTPTFTAGSKVLTLPDAPTEPSSLVVMVNGFSYVGAGLNVSGATVTLNFNLRADDIVSAEYR